MKKLLLVSGIVFVALGGLLAGAGWFFNTFTGPPADPNIGAGIMMLFGLPIVGLGVLVLLAWATVAFIGFRRS